MDTGSGHEITGLLHDWAGGDQSALDRLAHMVDAELRRVARSYLAREPANHAYQTTEIINEVFLHLIDGGTVTCRDRSHFFTLCAQMMRRILVDHARTRRRVKRGGGALHLSLDEACVVSRERITDVIVIDKALTSLSRADPRKGKVVELRFFGGLSVEETAEVLQISSDSVVRDWRLAKLWLLRELRGAQPSAVASSDGL
ncbi:MAG: sigma-70 family RNA polymerase sigma factor [Acidobacteria bacterium]|nr:sigma-70 family RNA polymerase sigma factor [Acidobacteriota bacterium]